MFTVTVDEFQDHLSAYLAMVEKGEELAVTDHNQVIGILKPHGSIQEFLSSPLFARMIRTEESDL